MSNDLNEEKKQQVIALGRLGWSLRKIRKATGVHGTTGAEYLRVAAIALRPPNGWGKAPPAKPTNEVTPDSGSAQPAAEVCAAALSANRPKGVTPTLAEALAYLDQADTRIHGTTKRQVAAMFAKEKPALLSLPIEPFRYYQYGTRTVNLDGCVEVDAAYYSAPPGWIGRQVQVQWDLRQVRLLHPQTGELLREHLP